jgi:hypothetical protein
MAGASVASETYEKEEGRGAEVALDVTLRKAKSYWPVPLGLACESTDAFAFTHCGEIYTSEAVYLSTAGLPERIVQEMFWCLRRKYCAMCALVRTTPLGLTTTPLPLIECRVPFGGAKQIILTSASRSAMAETSSAGLPLEEVCAGVGGVGVAATTIAGAEGDLTVGTAFFGGSGVGGVTGVTAFSVAGSIVGRTNDKEGDVGLSTTESVVVASTARAGIRGRSTWTGPAKATRSERAATAAAKLI